jgi:DNA-binding Xre family transcriptional regulator
MQDNTDFVFPAKMEVIEKTEQISSDVFTENEQNVNLKRCKRLNFYGKKNQIQFFNIL